MTKEFKKITKGSETRYVLDEFATGGSSSSSAVASAPGTLGGVRSRNDNLLAQEAGDKKEAPKPRNFVAKNAKMGGAGAHKDKKKAQKQGQEKHRKPYMEELKDRLETIKSKVDEGEYRTRGNPKAYDADVRAATSGFGRPADHRGLGQELGHEKNNVGIWINGKLWKVLDGSSFPGAYEYAMKGANKMKISIERNAAAKGRPVPKVEFGPTAANPTEGVAEADKHSMLGKIQRHQELKKKVDTSFADIGKAQQAGDHPAASKAFRKHERYANLERPGTWTKVDEQGVAEDDAGDIEQRFAVKMEKEKQRLARLKQTDPEAYKREIAKRKTSSRIPPVSTFEQQGVAEGSEFGAYYSEKVAQEIFNKRQDITSEDEVLNQAYHIVSNELGQKAARYKFNYDEDFPSEVVSNYFWLKKHGQGVAEGDNAEYDDEAGMADNNLETLKRAVQGLDDIISAGDNLPEWCQEKIAVAKSMLVAVWDYMQSEEQDMSEELGYDSLDAESARKIMQELDRGVPMHELFMEYPELSRMYDNIAGEMGLHGDDDNDEIEGILYDQLDDLAHSDRYTEAAPKGWEGTVKAMKKHKDIDNPWALAHWMKNKGYKSHKKEDAYMEELSDKLSEKLLPSMDLDTWKADFKAADPNKYHQFKNKTDDKKDQMATAALYKARQPKSK